MGSAIPERSGLAQSSGKSAVPVPETFTTEAIGDWHLLPRQRTPPLEGLLSVDHRIARKRSGDSTAESDGEDPDQRTCAGRVRLIPQIPAKGLVSDQTDSGAHARPDEKVAHSVGMCARNDAQDFRAKESFFTATSVDDQALGGGRNEFSLYVAVAGDDLDGVPALSWLRLSHVLAGAASTSPTLAKAISSIFIISLIRA